MSVKITKYLQSAVKRYKGDYNINPISETDAQIISLLLEHTESDIYKIFENYKYLKDEEILEELVKIKDKRFGSEQEGKDDKPTLIHIKGRYIREKEIMSIQVIEEDLKIIINPMSPDTFKFAVADVVVKFRDIEELHETLDKMIEKFEVKWT